MIDSAETNYNLGNLCDTDYLYLTTKIYKNKLDELRHRVLII